MLIVGNSVPDSGSSAVSTPDPGYETGFFGSRIPDSKSIFLRAY
jgi:hypothetical protein